MKSFYIRYQSPWNSPSITAIQAAHALAARETFEHDNPMAEVLLVWPQKPLTPTPKSGILDLSQECDRQRTGNRSEP